MSLLAWEHLRVSQEELEGVAAEMEAWITKHSVHLSLDYNKAKLPDNDVTFLCEAMNAG